MTVNVNYPGVYISESDRSGVFVSQGNIIIPLFISFGSRYPSNKGILCFDNRQELDNYGVHYGYAYYNSLSAWFDAGGGKCYLAQTGDIETAVQKYDEINLIVSAGFAGYQSYNHDMDSQAAVITAVDNLAASGKPVFALLDGPQRVITSSDSAEVIMKDFSATPHAAVFYPWCRSDSVEFLAPSIVVALAIVKNDSIRGVWKAPCNIAINGITSIYSVTDELQGKFNQGKVLNMLRTFPDTGTVLWGARTLEDSDNWRYIPVRRLFNMVDTDIKKLLRKLISEPNSQPTWQRAKSIVDNYLHRLWQQGALVGNTPEYAWFTAIGKDTTMTDDDIYQGKLVIKIGLAAVRPAEFIILQVSQDISQYI
ncbi:phage tail sheath family protein [Serratia sp. CY76391]|uniref:phage tail sheath family protein n=1 Tax=Serratia sp. CY76391 TaxID=3383681 RepID=UPI003FA0CC29